MRYYAIMTCRLRRFLIAVAWLAAMLITIAPVFSATMTTDGNNRPYCQNSFVITKEYLYVLIYLGNVVPFCIIVLVYIAMYIVARKQRSKFISSQVRELQELCSNETDRDSISVPARHTNPENEKTFRIRFIKLSSAARTSFLITSSCAVGWLPFCTLLQFSMLCDVGSCPVSMGMPMKFYMFSSFSVLYCSISAVNPLIYIYRDRYLRNRILGIFKRNHTEIHLVPQTHHTKTTISTTDM